MNVLVLGATGYVGGRLVPELVAAGHRVRCAARTPAKLDGRAWREHIEVVAGDVTDTAQMGVACAGQDVVVFLVHAMDGRGAFAERERHAAMTVRQAAEAAGVRHIVYLGGLGDASTLLSHHLASRHAVGHELAAGDVVVTELRAGVVIGSGSASFEMLRHLVEKLPVMVTPRWVDTRAQPIAIRDVLRYLSAAVGEVPDASRIIEIGGADVLTYRQMMQRYAAISGLRRRWIVGVPVLTPRLSSLWIGLVTPLPAGLARPLVDSLSNEVVVRQPGAESLATFQPLAFDDALRAALRRVQDLEVVSTWASATGWAAEPQPGDPDWAGGTVLVDTRRVASTASSEQLFATVSGIGGQRGWYGSRLLWGLRGALDELVGGAGLRRGRRHPTELVVGDVVDFWRVDAIEPGRLLRLRAEMRLPGVAWLEFRVDVHPRGSQLVQRARFHPRGLWGRVYWYALAPFHSWIFPRMARRIALAAAERR